MVETGDIQLLREFAEHRSDAAFATLVQRYVNLVYSVGLRKTGNPHAAEEITQAVFIILARKASSLTGGWLRRPRRREVQGQHRIGIPTSISGWLYQTARFTAINYRRSEFRRTRCEQEAHMQSILNETEPDVWPQIAPLLDDALGRLAEKDRHAIVLRYFENKSLGEIGVALGASEDAAKMRVHRALEKLRKIFSKRGVTLSATLIASAVAANSVQTAPTGLAISAVAVANSSAVTASTLTLVKGALKLMAWTKAKTAIVTTAGVLLAVGTGTALFLELSDPVAKAKRMMDRGEATPLNLTAYYTMSASAFDGSPRLATIPRGFRVFANLPFEIGGMITLWGQGAATKYNANFSKEVSGIEVKRKFETLYVYHGAYFASADGEPVCDLVFRYADGSSLTNRLHYGAEVLDWEGKPVTNVRGPTGKNSTLAWVGGSFEPGKKSPLRLSMTALENPQAKLEVTSIDLYSCQRRTSACIMAMTTGKAGLMKKWRPERN